MRQKALRICGWSVAALLLVGCATRPVAPLADIHLVRHAEKVDSSRDAALSNAGHARAVDLADRLSDAGIAYIYSTDYQRTRDTAAPLAERLGLDVRFYDPSELDALARTLRGLPDNSLVVGHSNTTPKLVAVLGGSPGPAIDEAREYNRLYILSQGASGQRSVHTELQAYGEPMR
ncbi:MAG: histidine phosphatase family protein [Litorimonas sp.]